MPLPRTGPDWQRRVQRMRFCDEFAPPEVRREGDGLRMQVFEVVYAPEFGLWWIDTAKGQWRLPPELHGWAAFVEDELAQRFGVDQLYPFYARFGRRRNEYLVDMDRPE